MILSPDPRLQFIDANGDPLASGKVHTYVSGTTTPLATYTDADGGTPNANPVILDTAGRAAIWLIPGDSYTFVVTDANDAAVFTTDGIVAPSDPTGNQTFTGNITFSGNGLRIKGDMTNTPAVNRLSVQTSIAASTTEFQILPSSGGASSAVSVFTDPLVATGQFGRLSVSATEVLLEANKLSGTYPKLVFNTGGNDNMEISNGGVVKILNPVAFSVNRAGSAFNVVNDTVTAVDWTAEAFDTNSSFDLTTDRFTPPAGYYHFSGTATCLGSVDGGQMVCSIYKNGSALHNGSRPSMSAADTITASSIAVTVYANGTDYFDFRVYQANPSSSTLSFSGTLVQLFFSGHRFG